jgi:hypothetical protein
MKTTQMRSETKQKQTFAVLKFKNRKNSNNFLCNQKISLREAGAHSRRIQRGLGFSERPERDDGGGTLNPPGASKNSMSCSSISKPDAFKLRIDALLPTSMPSKFIAGHDSTRSC